MVTWRYSASSPRTIAPRADLTETERTTIKLFQTVSPNPQNLLKPGQEESDVQTGTGIVWDSAGHDYAGGLADMPVADIDTTAVLKVLTPLWQATPATAMRVRGRIEAVLDSAKAMKLRSGENPAA